MGRSDKKVKTRVSVTITKPYLDAMDHLVQDGIYRTKGEIVLEALRAFFRQRGTELPYYLDETV